MRIRSISLTIVSVLLGIILSWQYTSILANNKNQKQQNVRLQDLMNEVLSEKKNNEDLRVKNL
jgi:hypothetical protein